MGNSKTCSLDPKPTQLLKSSLDGLLPLLCKVVNASAVVPPSLGVCISHSSSKGAIFELFGYEKNTGQFPIFHISQNALKNVVVKCLNVHMAQYHCNEDFQSTSIEYHSMETALMSVDNNIYPAIEHKNVCV